MGTLSGKRVAFCGRLTTEKKSLVIARLEMLGGRHVDRVTSRTDILVLPYGYRAGDEAPKQVQDAEELQKKGDLKIMDELEFLLLLDS